MRNIDEVIAAGALDLPAGMLFVTRQVLLAMGTLKFEFAHGLVICSLVRLVAQVALFADRQRWPINTVTADYVISFSNRLTSARSASVTRCLI
jgi:hypothetical protein